MIAVTLFASAHAQWTEPVRISSDPHLMIPRAVAVEDTLHVAATTLSNIFYMRSNDNGETWTDPICPVDYFYGSRWPDILFSNSRLHMAFIGRSEVQEPDRVYNVSSTDGGRTWGEPYEVYYNGWKYPRLAGVGDTLFLSCAIPGRILVFVSYDNGQTWSEPSVVDSGPLVIDHPPNILYSQGRLHTIYQINIVGDSIGVEIYHRYSEDYGDTWSDRYPLSTLEYGSDYRHSQAPSAYVDSSGNIMALWFDYKYGSECGVTGDILGRVSTDNGESWLRETRLTFTQTGSGSACLILNDTLYAIWMDQDYLGCGYPKLMYSKSSDWSVSWDQPEIIYESAELLEYGPIMFHNQQVDSFMLQCIMWAEPPDGPKDLYYVKSGIPTKIIDEDARIVPDKFAFSAYPNPFNSTAMITFNNLEGDNTEIEIFNLLGQRIRSFTIEGAKEGRIIWDATDAMGNKVSSGIYFARARTSRNSNTIKLIYLK